MKTLHVIVNPHAQNRRGYHVWKHIQAELERRGAGYEVVFSKSAAHLLQVVSGLTGRPGIRLLVIGGDGTLNQAVNGIADFQNVRIGYIPAGSANDFWRSLSLPSDPVRLLHTILEDRTVRRMDVGTLAFLSDTLPEEEKAGVPFSEKKRFVVSCGIGFDAAVCAGVAKNGTGKRVLTKLGLAKLSYIFVALRQIFGNKSIALDGICDDGRTIHLDHAMFLAAMNLRYEGGGFMFAPDADYADGRLDLCVVGDISVPRFLRSFPLAYRGKHFLLDGVDHIPASGLEIRTERPMWVHTDGEVCARSAHIRVGCEKQALQLLV